MTILESNQLTILYEVNSGVDSVNPFKRGIMILSFNELEEGKLSGHYFDSYPSVATGIVELERQ